VWLHIAENVAVSEIANRLGLQPRRNNSFAPCPKCGEVNRGSSDNRGPIGLRGDDKGWKCHKCGAGGSGIDMVTYRICGSKFSEADSFNKTRVRTWFDVKIEEGAEVLSAPKRIRGKRPPVGEVHSLWKASRNLNQLNSEDQALKFLKGRNLNLSALSKSGVVRITPDRKDFDWPGWWPAGRSSLWRIVAPAFTEDGEFVSLHSRAVDVPKAGPKTLWPKGFEAKGLFMPNRYAVKMLRGVDVEIDGVLFVEGITDFMKCSAEVEDQNLKIAILAGTSGSFGCVSKLKIPKDTKIYIGTDPDEAGKEYAKTIQLQLADRISYRIPLHQFVGEDNA
jgi:5S rRNA maturation endonuclease (ribonuclease M5)